MEQIPAVGVPPLKAIAQYDKSNNVDDAAEKGQDGDDHTKAFVQRWVAWHVFFGSNKLLCAEVTFSR